MITGPITKIQREYMKFPSKPIILYNDKRTCERAILEMDGGTQYIIGWQTIQKIKKEQKFVGYKILESNYLKQREVI